MTKQERINGNIYNISSGKGKLCRGWNLIVTDDGHEYVMRRDFSASSKKYRKLYQTNVSLKGNIYEHGKPLKLSATAGISYISAVTLVPLIRALVPKEFLIGPGNIPVNVLVGIGNMLIVACSVSIFLSFVSFYRTWIFKQWIQSMGGNLSYIGKIRSEFPYRIAPNGREYW